MEAFKINRFSFKRHENVKVLPSNKPDQFESKFSSLLNTNHRLKQEQTPLRQNNHFFLENSLLTANSFCKGKIPISDVGTYGLNNLYTIYSAVTRENLKDCSLVVIHLYQIDKFVKSKRREASLSLLRNEPIQLERIKHSRFLQIFKSYEESQDFISFPIETTLGSLRTLIFPNKTVTEFEIISGIYQLTDGLRYLHSSLQLMHCNISPNSILLNSKRQWKIAGLNFLEPIIDTTKSVPNFTGFDENKTNSIQPDLDYIAPEAQLQKSMSQLADMYSLGMVICGIYNDGKSLIDAKNDIHTYVRNLTEVPSRFNKIAELLPKNLRDAIRKMISEDIRLRPTSQLFSLLQIFNDPIFLSFEKLMTLDNETMSGRKEFFNQFATQIKEYNSSLVFGRILPELKFWCFYSSELTPFVMPSIVTLIRLSDDQDYTKYLEETFHKLLDLYEDPRVGSVLLDLLEFYIDRLSVDQIKSHIIETLIINLKSDIARSTDVVEKAAKIIPVHIPQDIHFYIYQRLKEIILLPTVQNKSKYLALRCLDILIDYIDSDLIINDILPFLSSISDPDSEMLLDILMIYRHLLLDRKFTIPYSLIATKLFPPLIPYLADKNIRDLEYKLLIDSCRCFLDAIDRGKMKELTAEMNSQSGSCSSINSQLYSNTNSSRVLPLIAMQKPTIDHESINRLTDYQYGLRSGSNSDTSAQGVFDISRPRSNSSEYYRRMSGEDTFAMKGSCKNILMANRKRASSHCSESFLPNTGLRSGNISANQMKMPISSSSGRIGQFIKSPISSSIRNISSGSNPIFPIKSFISNDSNMSSLSPRGSVSSARNRSPSTTSLINQAIERRRYSGNNTRYSNFQPSNCGTPQRLSLTNTILDPRRHSYGSSAPSSVHNLITSNVCEGPFISPQNSRFQSRRTSSQSIASRFNSSNLFTSNK